VKFGDVIRAPAGSVFFYRYSSVAARDKGARSVHGATSRGVGGKIHIQGINGFTRDNEPAYLLQVIVAEPAEPRRRPGRKAKSE
jgi:hypothetical protein